MLAAPGKVARRGRMCTEVVLRCWVAATVLLATVASEERRTELVESTGGSYAYHSTQPYECPDHRVREGGQGSGQYQGHSELAIHGRDRTPCVDRRYDRCNRLS